MLIFPAIDLFEGKAVRLYKGDYDRMTVYSEHPVEIARDFEAQGARCIHMVDLEGARNGLTPNLDTVRAIASETPLFTEVGGGIRSMEIVERYISAGVDRVILGTAAVTDEEFLRQAAKEYGDRIAVGVDIRDGFVAIRGWTEKTALSAMEFCGKMQETGVSTVICTDISRDGAMQGANHELYETMSRTLSMNIIASGGVSSLADVKRLRDMGLHGAIIGKAYYTGAVSLKEAIEVAK